MNIRDISIDGFGVWTGLRLDDLDERINVFYGPNEAGKTTLMQFLRAMLYGFSADRRGRYLPPVHGGRPGGQLTIGSSEGSFLLRRHATSDDRPAGALELLAGSELIRDEGRLARLLGAVDEAVYRNVFAIGLREIQELGSLSDNDAAQWLYKLSTGADRVSLVDVLSELAKARGRLLSAGPGPSTISQLLAERDKLRRGWGDRAAVRQFLDLRNKRRDLAAQIAAWESEAETTERAARQVEIAAAIHERWHQRSALDKELAESAGPPRLAREMLDQCAALAATIDLRRKRSKILARRLARNRQEIEALGLNEALWRHSARLEAILEQEQWIAAIDAERAQLAQRVEDLAAQRAELCARLGFDPALSPAEVAGNAAKAWQQLKPLAQALRTARQELGEVTEEVSGRQQSASSAAEELAKALKARNATSLTTLLERSGEVVSQLRRRVQLDDRLAELSRHKKELEERGRELLANAMLPGWALIWLGVLFVVGVVAALAGVALPASLIGSGRWLLVTAGVLTSGGTAAAKFLMEKGLERRSKTCLAQLDAITGQIEEATHERDALDEVLPKGGGPLLARLQAAEKERAAIEALMPLETKRLAAAEEAGGAEGRRERAHEEYIHLRRRWREALLAAGLSPKTSPGRAQRLAHTRRSLGQFDTRLAAERAELAQRQNAVETFFNRLAQVRADLDLPEAGQTLGEQLRALREQLHEQTALAARRRSLRKRGQALRERGRKNHARLRRGMRQLKALLDQAGVADLDELQRREQESARRDQLANNRDALAADIAALVGSQAQEAELERLIASRTRPQLDEQWVELSGRVQKLREQVKAAHEQLGRWAHESQVLATDRRSGQVRLQLDALELQLRDAVRRWQVLATAEWLLADVRKKYERERQPETLREASGYLERLTEGRYRRVWTPLEESVLRVDDAQGNALPVEVLSRGTREQLFLSLRLALVSWYARRGIALPLVLDDVLVNFDARRARAAAELLRDFAATGHQLLVFTCHEHMYQLFRSLAVPGRELPANPRAAAFGPPVPLEPVLPPVVAAVPEPVIEPVIAEPVIVEAEPVQVILPEPVMVVATNGHQPAVIVEAPPVAPPPEPPRPLPLAPPVMLKKPVAVKDRAHVKFDCVHGPRGPFATSIWHDRITYEVSGEVPELSGDDPLLLDPDDEWTDIEPHGTD